MGDIPGRDLAAAIFAAADKAKADRATRMPDEASALRQMNEAYLRLKELGWSEAIYCPKDGSGFDVVEPGCSGRLRAHYYGEWPAGGWMVEDGGDLWPSHPILFRLDPEVEAARKGRMRAAIAEFTRDGGR